MGTQVPPKKGHSSPHFSSHVSCGETSGWIKIPLGKMPLGWPVGLGPGDIVLIGHPEASSQTVQRIRQEAPHFWLLSYALAANWGSSLMSQVVLSSKYAFLLIIALNSFDVHSPFHSYLITFHVSHSWRKMYCGHARLCVCLFVCPWPHTHTIARTRM